MRLFCLPQWMLLSFVTSLQDDYKMEIRSKKGTAALNREFQGLSETHPRFGQTCLFTNFPNISTTVRGSEFKGIREKAGL